MIPGETRTGPGELILNSTLSTILISVVNDGDRPIQVGSHLHFPDANPALSFDRSAAEGFRLDIPSGTSLRFEPGVGVDVPLVALGGRRHVPGILVRAARPEPPAAGTGAAGPAALLTPGAPAAAPTVLAPSTRPLPMEGT
ncbi:urease subunit beta [Streptomyces albidoflavus]|uniref:urease subunit beta n=1 Tax=Streptomyces albidoflavus TaxID=1886 RepID=UPI00101E4E2A|nr:urease subunit beta [Streptomyces albidoflavus]RZD82435.1 urease subunit beta [Streptomyces albidoflavus]